MVIGEVSNWYFVLLGALVVLAVALMLLHEAHVAHTVSVVCLVTMDCSGIVEGVKHACGVGLSKLGHTQCCCKPCPCGMQQETKKDSVLLTDIKLSIEGVLIHSSLGIDAEDNLLQY